MSLTDIISRSIIELLDDCGGIAEIQRNELAGRIGCVPSQINYVITSRFTQEKGYMVESRRGGGGYIKISRINLNPKDVWAHLINSIGERLDEESCRIILQNLMADEILKPQTARLIYSAVTSAALRDVPQELRDNVRATIIKNMLLAIQ